MAKPLCFLIHGIGRHGTQWAEEPGGPVEVLKEASRSYAHFQSRPLEDRVEFVPIHYDDVFEQAIAKWQGDAAAVEGLGLPGPASALVSWLPTSNAEAQKLWWTYVADLALYRLTRVYRQQVRARVLDQIASRIEAEAAPPPCSVLAHSMGTAVAHDCLHLLGTVRWAGAANALSPLHWRFDHLFMVANASRLLQTDDPEMKKAYESIVRPGPLEDPGSYCATYWNFRHEADPVPFPRMFEPAGWKNFTSVVVRHYREPNVHGLSHYLVNPRVHIPILRRLVGSKAVTPEEETAAVNPDNFPMFGGKFAAVEKGRQLAARLEELKAGLGEDPAASDLFRGLVRYFELAKEAS